MQKKNLFFALAASAMLFTACSSDEPVVNGPDNGANAQEIAIAVSNINNLGSRAGRPLEGSEAKHTIENVRVIITNNTDNKVVHTLDLDWVAVSSPYSNGKEYTVKLTGDNKLDEGNYTAYAIGYPNSSGYTDKASKAYFALAKGDTFDGNIDLGYSVNTNNFGEEIFAGSHAITVGKDKGFKASLVLNRQVAGTFGYFTEIPYVEGARYLFLEASASNSRLVLGKFLNTDINTNGDNAIDPVVNGYTAASTKVIYKIDLNTWFTKIEEAKGADGEPNGLIDVKNWKNPYSKTENGKTVYTKAFKKGSVFAGTFVIPFEKTSGETFTLKLAKDESGTQVVRTWNVTLPNKGQVGTYNLTALNETGAWADAVSVTDTPSNFSVLRNNLYTIGKKINANPKDPEDPEPDPDDPDEPEPLNTKQNLEIKVNHNWSVIYNMGVD